MPKPITLEWDEANEAHATRHGVSRAAIDEVVTYGVWVMLGDTRGRAERRRLIGAAGVRVITVVLQSTGVPYRYRPIAAWPATPREIRLYSERRRRR